MLIDEHFIEDLLAVFACYIYYLFILEILISLLTLLFLFFLLLFHCFYGRPKVLWCSLPVLASFGLIEPLTFRHSHFFLLFDLCLLDESGLNVIAFTCYLEVILLAYELNSLRLDIKTSLQAFACFSKAFLLNLRPQPYGQRTKSF